MAPRRLISAALAAGAAGALAVPAAAQAAPCPSPGRVAVRAQGAGTVLVSWSPSRALRRSRASFRVLRGSEVVGQTRASSMRVRVPGAARVTVRVGVVGSHGRAPRCYAARRVPAAALGAALAAPSGLGAQVVDLRTVNLSWRRVPGARAYRVLRDGRVVAQTPRTSLQVALAADRPSTFTVLAVAASGRAGRASAGLRVSPGASAPSAPSGLTAPVVTAEAVRLSWTAAAPGTAPVAGYRISRDGLVVGQVARTSADVTGLAHGRRYALAVAAVDTRGRVGPPATLAVRTELPTSTRGRLRAFLLASTDESFVDLQRHADAIGTVYPTYFDCDPDDLTAVVGRDDPLVTQWAHDHGIRVLPRLNCQRTRTLQALFADPAARATLIARLVDLTVHHDYDGLNLDFEAGAPQDRDGLTAFVADLAAALHAAGRTLTVDVSAKVRDEPNHPRSTFFDYRMLSRYADEMLVMAWGMHWLTSAPGPLAPTDWVTRVTDYVASMPDPGRFVLGQPLYGIDWPAGGGPASPGTPVSAGDIPALAAQHGAQPVRDAASGEWTLRYADDAGVAHEVWWPDAAVLQARMAPALGRGLGGLALWRLGQEDPGLWTLPTFLP